MCVNWVLEVLARTEGVVSYKERNALIGKEHSTNTNEQDNIDNPLIPHNQSQQQQQHRGDDTLDNRITYRKFDFTAIFEIFAGMKGNSINKENPSFSLCSYLLSIPFPSFFSCINYVITL